MEQRTAGPGGLQAVNANLKIKTTTLTLGNVVLKDAQVNAVLRNGKLTADLPAFTAFGGSWAGKMNVDASAAKPAIAIDMTGDNVGVSSLLGTLPVLTSCPALARSPCRPIPRAHPSMRS